MVEAASPDAEATFDLPGGQVLRAGQRIVTYVARKLEPYRGFPQFLQALAILQAVDPDVQALVIGADGINSVIRDKLGAPYLRIFDLDFHPEGVDTPGAGAALE